MQYSCLPSEEQVATGMCCCFCDGLPQAFDTVVMLLYIVVDKTQPFAHYFEFSNVKQLKGKLVKTLDMCTKLNLYLGNLDMTLFH